MEHALTLLAERRGDLTLLRSPTVGLFTCARPRGALLGPGEEAGLILTLSRAQRLLVPPGVFGRVQNERPARVREPAGHGALLYELAPLTLAPDATSAPDGAAAVDARANSDPAPRGLVFRSPQSGRFHHRPAPDAPPFVTPGSVIDAGAPIGLIEVMKTFAHLHFRPTEGLPSRARVLRLLVPDGADLTEGLPLLELEPAPSP